MIDIKFLRENPDAVRENIRKKFQDAKLPLVDDAIRLDAEKRAAQQECEQLKAARNKLSKANGPLYGQLKKADEAQKAELQKQIDENNAKVKADDERRAELEKKQAEAEEKLREIMYVIPNIIDPSVPIGPDDSHNVEVQRFGDPSYLILRFPITLISCSRLTASIRIPQAAWLAWAFIICWAILHVCTRRFWPTHATS